MTFGIPTNDLPVTYAGELKRTNHNKWLSKRNFKEQQTMLLWKRKQNLMGGGNTATTASLKESEKEIEDMIDLPGTHDVLVGRGSGVNQHLGNIRVKHYIHQSFQEYTAAARGDKHVIAYRIVMQVKEEGRFLKQHPAKSAGGWWIPVEDQEAIKKISNMFRGEAPFIQQQQQQQQQHKLPEKSPKPSSSAGTSPIRKRYKATSQATKSASSFPFSNCFSIGSGGKSQSQFTSM